VTAALVVKCGFWCVAGGGYGLGNGRFVLFYFAVLAKVSGTRWCIIARVNFIESTRGKPTQDHRPVVLGVEIVFIPFCILRYNTV